MDGFSNRQEKVDMTIKESLNRAAAQSPDRVALQYRSHGRWETTTYEQLHIRARQVTEILEHINAYPKDRIAIYRENSPEWYELYYGIMGLAAVAVPVDAKLREQEVSHIFHDCGVSVVFCSAKNLPVVSGMAERLQGLHSVIVLDAMDTQLPEGGRVEYHSYNDLLEETGSTGAYERIDPQPDDLASLLYTSGTTGRQKGAVLTHRNFMSNVESIVKAIDVGKADNFMLLLPLHHSFAFTTMLLLPAYAQCQVSFVENLKTIQRDMAATSPTALLAVPLLLEKMLARIMDGIEAKPLAKLMFRCGMGRIVGRKIHEAFGGALRLIVSGGAPISPATLNAWTKLGFDICEGYGVTETAPVLCVNPIGKPRVGTVGIPIEGVEIQIDEPDASGTGEIIDRGPNIMEVLKNGWYHTGDMGHFDEQGYLVISGRKKSLIVNREGKNIYPEEVELQVMKSDYVLECIALGYRESNEDTGERVGLLAVPNLEIFETMEDSSGTRVSDAQIEEMVRSDIKEQLKALSDYKRPRRIEVRFEGFERTTTQKVKRYLYAIDTSAR
jgi:long-chain acyl-CoA synthetase